MRCLILLVLLLLAPQLANCDTTIYASSTCALNTNLYTGGGSDDKAALQALLDTVPTSGRLHVIVDGPARITGKLLISSNTTLEFLPGAGLYLTSGSNSSMIQNKHPIGPGGTIVDQNFTIKGGFFNGNGANQDDSDGTGANGIYTNGMNFYGVSQVTLDGVQMYNSRVWGVSFWRSSYVTITNYSYDIVPGNTRISQDGIDLRGPCDHFTISNSRFNTYDDAIALNARDSQGITGSYGGPYVGNGGPITDVTMTNITLDNALFGIDLISESQRVDRIVIDGLHGTCQNQYLSISNYPYAPYPAVTSSGNVGTVTVSNVDVSSVGSPFLGGNDGYWNLYQNIRLQASIEVLNISNYQAKPAIDSRPVIHLMPSGGYTIGTLTINGFSAASTALLKNEGRISTLNLLNASGLTANYTAYASAPPETINVTNWPSFGAGLTTGAGRSVTVNYLTSAPTPAVSRATTRATFR